MHTPIISRICRKGVFHLIFLLTLSLVSAQPAQPAPAIAAAIVTGTVSNAATRNLLEGAQVELPQLGRSVLTDNTGRFVLGGIPPGTYDIVVMYLGLSTQRTSVVVAPGERAVRNFDLTADIYRLPDFKVLGEREGSAAALVAQRNAPNLKNVVSIDSFGQLPNMSLDQLIMRLPGVTADMGEGGDVGGGMSVRGQGAGLNMFYVDDGALADAGGFTRVFAGNRFNAAMYDQVELIKGHTPDKGADSLGGTINLKSRSPLSMREKRRMGYNIGARWAPSFTEHIPLRRKHPIHPLLNFSYQEVFSVRGGDRNLGIAANAFWSERFQANFRTQRDFQNTLESPAYMFSYANRDAYLPAYTGAGNVKIDYRHSPTTLFNFNVMYNSWNQVRFPRWGYTLLAAQSVGTTGNAGILPGYTDRITEARPAPGTRINVSNLQSSSNYSLTRTVNFGGEHEFERIKIDYSGGVSYMIATMGNDNHGADMGFTITGIGWIIDRTESDLYPRVIQTAGPDITNSANYTPNGFLSIRENGRYNRVPYGRANVRYEFPFRLPLALKTGLSWRRQDVGVFQKAQRRWTYIGRDPLPHDPSLVTWSHEKMGLRIPQWRPTSFVNNDQTPVSPELWREDEYFRLSSPYTSTEGVVETVSAGYVMGQGRVGRFGYLAGVRTEKTEDESWGWVRAHSPSTAAQQAADPAGAVARDYADTFRQLSGSYTKSFPSAHLNYAITPGLKARLSWSTSFGRPDMNNLLPNETANDILETLTVNNPALKPQTAQNWDASLDYYFEPVGNLSVGWFHKNIRDYIVRGISSGFIPGGIDNGYNGEYEGYEIRSTANAGTAIVDGWEFSYHQQLTFLPRFLKGLSVTANYTILNARGDFGGTTNLSTDQIPRFIPRSGNINVSWRHGPFSARILVNQNSRFLYTTAASAARLQYKNKYTLVNAGAAYQFRPWLSFNCEIENLFNEPLTYYRGRPDRMQLTIYHGTTVTFGVNGTF